MCFASVICCFFRQNAAHYIRTLRSSSRWGFMGSSITPHSSHPLFISFECVLHAFSIRYPRSECHNKSLKCQCFGFRRVCSHFGISDPSVVFWRWSFSLASANIYTFILTTCFAIPGIFCSSPKITCIQ